jgi:YegS C-terminal NAD kinase beta sandwich-like domain
VSGVRPGEPWGSPASAPPDLEVTGDDVALAAAARAAPGGLVRFRPDATSDLARAVGLRSGADPAPPASELPVDAVRLLDGLACNAVVLGVAPDRLRWRSPAFGLEVVIDGEPWFAGHATTLVVANGQFLRGADLAPRGHPGDGRLEVQVYALRRSERRAMRRRLATGTHLPHARIHTRTARTVDAQGPRPLALEVDGRARTAVAGLRAEVVPAAFRLLV